MEAKGRLQDRLTTGGLHAKPQGQDESGKQSPHSGSFRPFRRRGKLGAFLRGTMLIELAVTMAVLTIFGMLLLKMALNITTPRWWTLYQTLTDAYMTYEKAYAQRVPFSQLTATTSAWPISPASTASVVEVGRMPGGQVVTGTVIRTRFADANNYPDKGGTITAANAALLNPGKVEVWKLQSILTYKINNQTYRKVRTVVRTQ